MTPLDALLHKYRLSISAYSMPLLRAELEALMNEVYESGVDVGLCCDWDDPKNPLGLHPLSSECSNPAIPPVERAPTGESPAGSQ